MTLIVNNFLNIFAFDWKSFLDYTQKKIVQKIFLLDVMMLRNLVVYIAYLGVPRATCKGAIKGISPDVILEPPYF